MKKKTLAAASLLLALLMPLGATPLAVYAEGEDEAPAGVSTVSEGSEGTGETKPLEWPDAAEWTVSCSKIATDLDNSHRSGRGLRI